MTTPAISGTTVYVKRTERARRLITWGLWALIAFFAIHLTVLVYGLFAVPAAEPTESHNPGFAAALSDGGRWVLDSGEFKFAFCENSQSTPKVRVESCHSLCDGETPPVSQTETDLMSLFEELKADGDDEMLVGFDRQLISPDEPLRLVSAVLSLRAPPVDTATSSGDVSTASLTIQRSSNDSVPEFCRQLFAQSQRIACRVRDEDTTGWAYATTMSQDDILQSFQAGASATRIQSDDESAMFYVSVEGFNWFILLGQSDNDQHLLMVLRGPESGAAS